MAKYLTVDELCEKLRLKKSRVYELTHQKKIPHIKLGRTLLFDEDEVEKWLKTNRVPVKEEGGIEL